MTCPPPSYCENAEGLFPSPSDSAHTTVEKADASTRVLEFLCVSAVLETEVLLQEWLPRLRLLPMLARHLDSRVGLHLAVLRMIFLSEKIHRSHINVAFVWCQTDRLRSFPLSCHCRRNPTIENVDTFFFAQPDPFVRVCV